MEGALEVEGAARSFEYYGDQAETVEGRSIPLGKDYFDFTTYEPFGVSARIIPWNYPVEMTPRSLSAALATGNACVIKSPELTPLTIAWFAHAAEAVGLPAGAVNIICGPGHDAGAALAAHPKGQPDRVHRIRSNRHRNCHSRRAQCRPLRSGTGWKIRGYRSQRC